MPALTELPLDIPQQLRHPPLEYNHLYGAYTLSLQSSVDALKHTFLLVRGDQYPPRPVFVRLGQLLRLVLGYKLVALAVVGTRHRASTYIEAIPLLLSVACGCPGLMDSRIYPNTHLR